MADPFTIKRHDTRPVLTRQLLDGNGNPVILTDADSVFFVMELTALTHDGTAQVKGACDITSPTLGVVTYTWAVGDTATSGTYDCEFEITWATDEIETVPNDTYFQVVVVDDLG